MKFAVTPSAFSDESMISHTLRLLKRNGLKHITHVLKRREIMRLIKWQKSKVEVIDKITFKKLVRPNISFPFWDKSLLTTVQVCPQCIKAHGYLKEVWQNPFVMHCEEHQCMLVSDCASCGESLKFDIDLLAAQCTNPRCSKSLCSQPLVKGLDNIERVFDCYVAAYVLSNLCTAPSKYPNESITQRDVLRGLELLNSKQNTSAWLKELVINSNRHIPLNVSLANVLSLTKYLTCDWPALKLLENTYDGDYSLSRETKWQPVWLTVEKAARLLCIDFVGLQQLRNAEVVKTKSGNRLNSRSVIDVSPIFRMLGEKAREGGMEPMSRFNQTMLYHDICIVDVLIAVLEGKLGVGYQANKELLSSIYVEPHEFDAFCAHTFRKKRLDAISVEKACQLTRLSKESLMKLREQGRLRVPRKVYDGGQAVFEDVLRIREQRHTQLRLRF